MLRRIISSILILSFILIAAFAITSFGRGYRFDFGKKSLTSTGILSIASAPEGASIFINGKLTSATNNSINLSPDWYDVKIVKEGYIPWQKRVPVKGEIVSKIDALLLPLSPSLRPLTTAGVLSPILSPTSNQLAYIVPLEASDSGTIQKSGIYVWDMRQGPVIPLGNGPRLLARSSSFLDFSTSTLIWSPDEKQLLSIFWQDNQVIAPNFLSAYLLDTSLRDQTPKFLTLTALSNILSEWQSIEEDDQTTLLASLPPLLSLVLSETSRDIHFSKDEDKIMYTATTSATIPPIIKPLIGSNSTPEERSLKAGSIYIYDIKEDKNYQIKKDITSPSTSSTLSTSSTFPLSPPEELVTRLSESRQDVRWYPDSKHILMLENGTIYITEYDGQNKTTVYAGPLEDSYVFPWPNGGRILILTNYNKAASAHPNLYAVDLR